MGRKRSFDTSKASSDWKTYSFIFVDLDRIANLGNIKTDYKDASPMPNIPEMTEVWTGAENMVINAASGKDTPKQAAVFLTILELSQTGNKSIENDLFIILLFFHESSLHFFMKKGP